MIILGLFMVALILSVWDNVAQILLLTIDICHKFYFWSHILDILIMMIVFVEVNKARKKHRAESIRRRK